MSYGCELEIADVDTRIILPAGKWDYKDGSIANTDGFANDPKKELNIYGGEINTDPTFTIKAQLRQIRKIYQSLGKYWFNHTTNLHIHIRIPGLSTNLKMLKKLQSYIYKYGKEMLDYIEPIPEVDNNLIGEYYNLAKRRERRRKRSHHWMISEKTYKRIMNAKTIKEFFEAYYPTTSTGKINYAGATRSAINLVQLYQETDTVEFRHFTNSDNIKELRDSFRFCKKFMIAGLTDWKNPIEIFKEGNYRFTKFWDFDPEIEKRFLLTNVLYNKRKDAIENIRKEKENAV